MKRVDQSDIQGNIMCGYRRTFPHALFAFVRVTRPAVARRWVGELAERVTTALPWGDAPPSTTLNVAFSFAGLRALGLPEPVLSSFPTPFSDGMEARAGLLGDADECAPERWEPGLRSLHAVVTIYAQERTSRSRARAELKRTEPGAGIKIVRIQETDRLDGDREPFGFRDGIAQPDIKDRDAGPHPRDVEVEPGEFVLGYRDEGGGIPEPPRELGLNGSYMVVRKLEQDVHGFWDFARAEAGDQAEWFAAKLVGRWRDGTPLVSSLTAPANGDEGDLRRLNDFAFARDVYGYGCPLGAHIRRTNPRDALDRRGRFSRRHRIIRRGMPYAEDGAVGLMFVCWQADIERQFEFIQSQWCGQGNAFGLGADPDPVMGPGGGKVTINGVPPRIVPLRRFVMTRGGDYFFAPGIQALRRIAAGGATP
ncbi:MAG TPA: Dyp-type peroxidase [Thermoleophilaceae bacterium]|nr:Dyp-type peroxidase [Thermoleophilaceae bacterium]